MTAAAIPVAMRTPTLASPGSRRPVAPGLSRDGRRCPGLARNGSPVAPADPPPGPRRTIARGEAAPGRFGLGGDRYLACFGLGIEVDPTDHPCRAACRRRARPATRWSNRAGRPPIDRRRPIRRCRPVAGPRRGRRSPRLPGGSAASASAPGSARCSFGSPGTEPAAASLAAPEAAGTDRDGRVLFGPESIEILVAGARIGVVLDILGCPTTHGLDHIGDRVDGGVAASRPGRLGPGARARWPWSS